MVSVSSVCARRHFVVVLVFVDDVNVVFYWQTRCSLASLVDVILKRGVWTMCMYTSTHSVVE